MNEVDSLIPRKLFSNEVSGQVIPNKLSKVTKVIIPQWHILNFKFLTQTQFDLYPIGIKKKPKVIKITMAKWDTNTISAINVVTFFL